MPVALANIRTIMTNHDSQFLVYIDSRRSQKFIACTCGVGHGMTLQTNHLAVFTCHLHESGITERSRWLQFWWLLPACVGKPLWLDIWNVVLIQIEFNYSSVFLFLLLYLYEQWDDYTKLVHIWFFVPIHFNIRDWPHLKNFTETYIFVKLKQFGHFTEKR